MPKNRLLKYYLIVGNDCIFLIFSLEADIRHVTIRQLVKELAKWLEALAVEQDRDGGGADDAEAYSPVELAGP